MDRPLKILTAEKIGLPDSILCVKASETKTADNEQNLRRDSQRRAPNRKHIDDYISPMISLKPVCEIYLSKRYHSSSDDIATVNVAKNYPYVNERKQKRC